MTQVVVDAKEVHVVTVGEAGPPGPQGPQGLPGAGGGDAYYRHNQGVASDTWVITHNLGKRPSVSIRDSAGSDVEGTVSYSSDNELTISFTSVFSGEAYLN